MATSEEDSGFPIQSGAPGKTLNDPRAEDREYKWRTYSIVVMTGVVGAAVVAVTFLVVDLLSGRPALWTPAVLGAALFLGESVGESPDFQPTSMLPVVLGYTMVHGVAFIAFASAVSAGRITEFHRQPFTMRYGLLSALLMFAGLEVFFFALGWLMGEDLDLAGRLGSGWIALANALAAIAMTATLAVATRRPVEERLLPSPPTSRQETDS